MINAIRTISFLFLFSCANNNSYEPIGVIVAEHKADPGCFVELDLSRRPSNIRRSMWEALVSMPDRHVFRTNFPSLSHISLFIPSPCENFIDNGSFIPDQNDFHRSWNFDDVAIRFSDHSDHYIIYSEILSLNFNERAEFIQNHTNRHDGCSRTITLPVDYNYVNAAFELHEFISRSGFPIYNFVQRNNQFNFDFYHGCDGRDLEMIRYLEQEIIVPNREPLDW